MIRSIRCSLITISFLISITSSVSADPTFSWQDSKGNTFFGSKPPVNAKNVAELRTNRVSKYSSDKVLKAYEGYHAGAAITEKPEGPNSVKEENLKLGDNQDNSGDSPTPSESGAQGAESEATVGDPREWEAVPSSK